MSVERLFVQQITIPATDFDLEKTLDSGQVFHWQKSGAGFIGTIGDQAVYVEQHAHVLKAECAPPKLDRPHRSSFKRRISLYFALDHPLKRICQSFPHDPVMIAATNFCRGLRIIRQPKWECLATFICSSMKQVAHIRQISLALRQHFGEPRTIDLTPIQAGDGGSTAPRAMSIGAASPPLSNHRGPSRTGTTARSTNYIVYTFPSAERIAQSSEQELRECALGYRAKNLLATARLLADRQVDLERLKSFSDADLGAALCRLPGVGSKVANCVMLFGYERLRAFPIDVWIARVLRKNYFPRARKLNAARMQTFTDKYFGDHGGYAQQYLFHHARTQARKSGESRHRRNLSRLSP